MAASKAAMPHPAPMRQPSHLISTPNDFALKLQKIFVTKLICHFSGLNLS